MSDSSWSTVASKKNKGGGRGGGRGAGSRGGGGGGGGGRRNEGRGGGRGGRGDYSGGRGGRGGRGDYSGGGGRGGGGARGGGRGGGGGGGRGPTNPTQAVSNIIPATVTPNFRFYMYSLDGQDKNGTPISSKGRRVELLRIGLFDQKQGLLARNKVDAKLIKDFERIVFCEGSFFFSARRIPFLVEFPTTLIGAKEAGAPDMPITDNGDSLTVNSVNIYCAPKGIAVGQEKDVGKLSLSMDRRCSNCTTSFVDRQALINHCSTTGHKPQCGDDEDGALAVPASIEIFTSFCNVALNRAMGERMARWGTDFVDPAHFTDPTDRQGRSMGVHIFRAYVSPNAYHLFINANFIVIFWLYMLLHFLLICQKLTSIRFERHVFHFHNKRGATLEYLS